VMRASVDVADASEQRAQSHAKKCDASSLERRIERGKYKSVYLAQRTARTRRARAQHVHKRSTAHASMRFACLT
jgi:hypothetical protein